jgi:AraC family transcriptional regulator, arabinose operon regulatory protein
MDLSTVLAEWGDGMRYVSNYRVPDHDDRGVSDKSSFLLVNSVGYYNFEMDMEYTHRKLGRRDFYLAYNHAGRMRLKANGILYDVGEGDVFIFSPQQEQYYGQETEIENYWVHFTGYGAYEALAGANLLERPVYHISTGREMVDLFEKLLEAVQLKSMGYELLCAGLLLQIMALVTKNTDGFEQARQAGSRRIIDESLKAIHKSLDMHISVAGLAAMSYLSPNRFSHLFKQQVGASPQEYIIDLRLNKAVELMRHTNLNIRQISQLSGIFDQLYFSRLFRKRFGEPPSARMQRIRAENGG